MVCKLIWICEYHDPSNLDTLVHPYENEIDAFKDATQSVIDYMVESQNELSSIVPFSWNNSILSILEACKKGNYRSALDIYSNIMNYVPTDMQYKIYVYRQEIFNSTIKEKFSFDSSKEMVDIKDKHTDIPCKQCGRNVNSSEDTCWYCGIKDPAC